MKIVALLGLVAMANAQTCPSDSTSGGGYCTCDSGYYCTIGTNWGCLDNNGASNFKSFTSQSVSCTLGSNYCDAPYSTETYTNFRSTWSTCLNDRYAVGAFCPTTATGFCSTDPCNVNGPDCDDTWNVWGSSVGAAFATAYIIAIIVAVCCCLVIPVGICFFMGFACFAAANDQKRARQNQQGAPPAQVGAPPAYPQ